MNEWCLQHVQKNDRPTAWSVLVHSVAYFSLQWRELTSAIDFHPTCTSLLLSPLYQVSAFLVTIPSRLSSIKGKGDGLIGQHKPASFLKYSTTQINEDTDTGLILFSLENSDFACMTLLPLINSFNKYWGSASHVMALYQNLFAKQDRHGSISKELTV